MSETQTGELPGFLAAEAHLGGREAYETDKAADNPEHLPSNIHRPSETLQTASLHQAAEKKAPGGGLKQLRHYYRMHTATLPPEEKQRQTVLEHFMEKTVAGMPPPVQAQARANFYQTQIREAAQMKEIAAARHDDVGIDR